MIRSIVLVRLEAGAPSSVVTSIRDATYELDVDGRLSCAVVADLGLRADNATFVNVSDFASEEAYRRYDLHPGHLDIRSRLVAPHAREVLRAQIELAELRAETR